MAYRPILISNYETGLENDLEPWLLPNDAFPELDNCYVFRGRILKKLGVKQVGRLTRYTSVALGLHTLNPQVVAGVFPLVPNGTVIRGSVAITDGVTTLVDDGNGNITGGGTIDYKTGAFTATFTTAPTGTAITATALYHPCVPCMGITNQDTPSLNQESLIVFDQQKAYRFDTVLQQFRDISFDTSIAAQTGPFSWTGSDSDFFWSINYANAVFTTNFVSADPIRFLATDPTTGFERWRPFQPNTSVTVAGDHVLTARLIFSYRGRMVLINTIEQVAGATDVFPQRARWSQNGTPYYSVAAADNPPTPFTAQADAWFDNQLGKGGYVDAPTREQALSGEFVDDNLVVFFERSTWILRYTADPANPFVWERVNIDFGSESTFSTISFDKGLFAVGSVGIITSDGNNVTRIDQKIPDEVFNFQNKNEGPKRVQGIRNFKRQLAYWTFPNDENGTFPNRVLVLNYIEASYSFFRDSFTCYGNYQPSVDITWAGLPVAWQNWDFSWSNPTGQSFDPQIVAGNQQGFVFQIDTYECPDTSLCLEDLTSAGLNTPPIVTSTNHNLSVGQFVMFEDLQGTGDLAQFEGKVWKVVSVPSVNTFVIEDEAVTSVFNAFVYTDSGEIKVLDNFELLSKRFNLGLENGRQTRLGYTDFFVQQDNNGEFQVEIFTDEDSSRPVDTCAVSLAQEPATSFENTKIWKRAYCQSIGQFFQYRLFLNDTQMFAQEENCVMFALHAMMLWVSKAGRLPYG